MKRIKKLGLFIFVFAGLFTKSQLYANQLLETYCSSLTHKAMLPYSDDQKQIPSLLVGTAAALKNLDLYYTAIKTDQQKIFTLSLLDNDLCQLIDVFNPHALIKPTSIFGTIKLTELLNTPILAQKDPRLVQNQALIKLFQNYPELRTQVAIVLSDLGQKATTAFMFDDTMRQWITSEHNQCSPLSQNISSVGYAVDHMQRALIGLHAGARLINWGLSMALPVPEPWNIPLYGIGIFLNCFASNTRTQQKAQEMLAKPTWQVDNPFQQSLKDVSTGLQNVLRMSKNNHLINLADELELEAIAHTNENPLALFDVLDTIGTIDACLALATAEANGTIQPITIVNSNLEQSLDTLWRESSEQLTSPWTWNKNAITMTVNNSNPNVQAETKKFLINLLLSQTMGYVISDSKTPITLSLIDTSTLGVTTLTQYANSKKVEMIAQISITPDKPSA